MSAKRRGVRLGLGLAGLAGAVWVIAAGWTLLQVRRELRSGMDTVSHVRNHLTSADLAAGRPLVGLRSAGADFAQAHNRVDGPIFIGVRFLPVVGRQLRSLSALSGAASKVSTVALDAAAQGRSVLNAGTHPLSQEGSTADALAALADHAEQQLAAVTLGPRDGLVAPLADARTKLASDLDQLRSGLHRASVGGRALSDLLTRSHRYLVFAANNAEMRSGSGMFLSVGELSTGPDGLHLGPFQTVTNIPVPAGAVPLSGDLAARWGWLAPTQEWRNLMASPRFDVQAPLAAQMWSALGHPPVDGVLALDSVTLQYLLKATGPVAAAGRQFDADNVVDELLHGEYVEFNTYLDAQNNQRREELGLIAGATFDALAHGGWSRTTLADGLARAARGRHILLWSRDAGAEAGWQALSVDGAVHPDSLMVSLLNRGGNKLDYFVHTAVDLSFTPQGRQTAVTVSITVQNRVPAGEPVEVAGPAPRVPVASGVYVGLMSITMPRGATGGHVVGVDQLAAAGEDGPTEVMAFPFQLAAGQTHTFVGRFLLPVTQGTLTVEPSARVPIVTWTSGGQSWSDTGRHAVAWKHSA